MIIKSYEIQKNSENFLKYNFFLLYGENIGLKKDIKDIIKIKDNFPNIIEEVRGINFIKGLKLKVDVSNFMSKLMKNKLLVVKAAENCIRLFPSLLSTTDELDMGIQIIKKTCKEMS